MRSNKVLVLFFAFIFMLNVIFPVSAASSNANWNNYYIKSDRYNQHSFKDMTIDSQDAIILVGYEFSTTSNSLGYQGEITKLNSQGTLVWSHQFESNGSTLFNKILIDSNNNIIVEGSSNSPVFHIPANNVYTVGNKPNIYQTHFLLKYAPDGSIVWFTLYENTDYQSIYDIKLGDNDSIVLAEGDIGSISLTTFDSAGKLVSNQNKFFSSSERFNSLNLDADSNLLKVVEYYTYQNYVSNYVLYKYDNQLQELWNLNVSSFVSNITDIGVETTKFNNIIISGSYSTDVSSDYNDYRLFSILVSKDGNIVWQYSLNTTDYNYISGSSEIFTSNETVLFGSTDSSNFPALNSDNNTFNGQSDLTLTLIDKNGLPITRSLLGGPGSEQALAVGITSDSKIICIAKSSFQYTSEIIVFELNSDGTIVVPMEFEMAPPFFELDKGLVLVVIVLILLFVFVAFTVYSSKSNKDNYVIGTSGKRNAFRKDKNKGSLNHCPHDGTRMLAYTSRTMPNAEFLLSKDKLDVNISNAVAMKKILPASASEIKKIALQFFDMYNTLEDVTLKALQCPTCHYIGAVPVNLPSKITDETNSEIIQDSSNSTSMTSDSIIFPKGPSLMRSLNPFPSFSTMKNYFTSILTFNKLELANNIRNPEITKMTSLALIANSLFALDFSKAASYLGSIVIMITFYYLFFLVFSFTYTSLLHTKEQDFRALDNFRLWGVIAWINLPITFIISLIETNLDPNLVIGSFSVILLLALLKLALLLICYVILLSYLTEIGTLANIVVTIVLFFVVVFIVYFVLILGLILGVIIILLS